MAKKKVYKSDSNATPNPNGKKPFYKRWWFIALVVIGIIGAIFGPKKDANKQETPATPVEENQVEETPVANEEPAETEEAEEPVEEFAITEDMSDEQKIENIIKKVVEDQYDSHELVNNSDGVLGDIRVNTYFPADKYWDGKAAVKAQDSKIVQILKLLKENNINYSYLIYEAASDFTDQYGNENKSTVMTVLMPKEEADKINYDKFDNSNLQNIAEEYYTHPSIK